MQPIIILGTVFYIKGLEEYYLENASFNEAFFVLIKIQFATLLQPVTLNCSITISKYGQNNH